MVFAFGNAQNWQQIFSGSFQAEPVPEAIARFFPIPRQQIPVLVESPAVACFLATPNGEATEGNYATLFQDIITGIQLPGQPDTLAANIRVFVNQINLFVPEHTASTYGLQIRFPFWFRSVEVSVWEYTGPVVDLTAEGVEIIRATTNEINGKVDQLLANGGGGEGGGGGGLFIPPGVL